MASGVLVVQVSVKPGVTIDDAARWYADVHAPEIEAAAGVTRGRIASLRSSIVLRSDTATKVDLVEIYDLDGDLGAIVDGIKERARTATRSGVSNDRLTVALAYRDR